MSQSGMQFIMNYCLHSCANTLIILNSLSNDFALNHKQTTQEMKKKLLEYSNHTVKAITAIKITWIWKPTSFQTGLYIYTINQKKNVNVFLLLLLLRIDQYESKQIVCWIGDHGETCSGANNFAENHHQPKNKNICI